VREDAHANLQGAWAGCEAQEYNFAQPGFGTSSRSQFKSRIPGASCEARPEGEEKK